MLYVINTKKIRNHFIAMSLGLSTPICFVLFDMFQIGQVISFENLVEALQSQNIYIFSIFSSPIILSIVAELLMQIHEKNVSLAGDFKYLKVILNASPDAVVFLNQEMEIVFQNNQFRLLFDNFQQTLIDTQLNKLLSQVEHIQKEMTFDSSISKDHPFLMSFKLTTYQGKKNYYLSFKDLKSLKDKESIIENQKAQMIEKNKLASLGEMAAGIAHEINNPLTVINSNNSLIQKMIERGKNDPSKYKKITSKTNLQVKRITTIISSLRNLSRGMANEDTENFNISQLLKEAISLAKMRNKMRNVIFKSTECDSFVHAHRGQVVQVILNLLNNAIDAIEDSESPWIDFTVVDKQTHIELTMKDSGDGIPEEIAKKIFMPMYTTKDIGKGTGLGLSLSRSFMEQNGGSLDLIQGSKRTTFKLTMKKAVPVENSNSIAS